MDKVRQGRRRPCRTGLFGRWGAGSAGGHGGYQNDQTLAAHFTSRTRTMHPHPLRISARRTILVLFVPWIASAAQAPTRSISVTGQAEVRVAPSQVNIIFGVETRNKALAAAKQEN